MPSGKGSTGGAAVEFADGGSVSAMLHTNKCGTKVPFMHVSDFGEGVKPTSHCAMHSNPEPMVATSLQECKTFAFAMPPGAKHDFPPASPSMGDGVDNGTGLHGTTMAGAVVTWVGVLAIVVVFAGAEVGLGVP
jgi:hypothetical protein